MNNIDKAYQNLLQDILDNGVTKQDRTGTGTISVFGRQIRHNMSDGFPLLTTKKMHWKSIVTELLWFLRGDTNIKYLVNNGCHIWDGDSWANYSKKIIANNSVDDIKLLELPITQEEFINKIKTDDEFAKKWGELGPIYGKQWRSWETKEKIDTTFNGVNYNASLYKPPTIDQIANLISELKTNPDSRRLMVNAWNVADVESGNMVLPPCHYGFQIYTREMSVQERKKYDKYFDDLIGEYPDHHITLDKRGVPRRAISLMWNQRSVDTFLGLPFNIASYGLLLEIIAKEVNMVPDELIGNLGDVHLYSNHIEQAKEQIGREFSLDERRSMVTQEMYNEIYNGGDPRTLSHSEIDQWEIPRLLKREPFELPTITINQRNWYIHEEVKEHLGDKTFIEKIESYRPEDFTLNNYQSHPAIKAPLSN